MTKSALLLPFCAILFLSGCKVTKQIQKSDTEKESATKVDSSGSVKADKVTESKVVTEITELVDSTAFITPTGKLITDPKEVTKESIAVPIKKKKTTKRTEDIKEVDKTQTKTEVKKAEKQETKVVTTDKYIKRTGLPWWIWPILLLVLAAYLFYRFYLKRFLK
jgi:hypothetical protein